MAALLLDTCAIVYVAEGAAVKAAAKKQIIAAALGAGLLVSALSAWEIGMLAKKKGVVFLPDPVSWFQAFLRRNGIQLAPLTPEVAIASSFLPEPMHGDPADRLLVATARALDVPIVTRDRRILSYARAGHVRAVAC